MTMIERIPNLSDDELETLYGNALRLAQWGTAQQRVQAETLLPVLGETREARLTAAKDAQEARRRELIERKAVRAKSMSRKKSTAQAT